MAEILFVDKLIDRFIYPGNVELKSDELKSLEIIINIELNLNPLMWIQESGLAI